MDQSVHTPMQNASHALLSLWDLIYALTQLAKPISENDSCLLLQEDEVEKVWADVGGELVVVMGGVLGELGVVLGGVVGRELGVVWGVVGGELDVVLGGVGGVLGVVCGDVSEAAVVETAPSGLRGHN